MRSGLQELTREPRLLTAVVEDHACPVAGRSAGVCAAQDLINAGSDVVVLQARARPGGRVEQMMTTDGRLVQLGGGVVGDFHTAYRELVGEWACTSRRCQRVRKSAPISLRTDASLHLVTET
jgi:hypothetical protein